MSIRAALRRRSLWLTLLAALLFGVLAYQFRSTYVVPVGSWYDRVAIRDGWWGDELADNQRYRWTSGHSEIEFANQGVPQNTSAYWLYLRLQGYRPSGASPVITLTFGSKVLQTINTTNEMITYGPIGIDYRTLQATGTNPRLIIDSQTFTVLGDSRLLGVKVASVSIIPAPEQDIGPTLPTLLPIVYVIFLSLFAYLTIIRQRILGIAAAIIAFAVAVYSLLINLPLSVWLLPTATIFALALLLITWRSELFGWYPPLIARLRSLPEDSQRMVSQQIVKTDKRIGLADNEDVGAQFIAPSVDAPQGVINQAPTKAENSKLKTQNSKLTLVLIAALIVYAIFALWLIGKVDFIGHADYADNAVVARNIAHGLGATTDYVAQFYSHYPSVQHAADTWPLLQPLITVPFLLVSDTTFAAKLPNLMLMLMLTASVFYVGKRIWDARVALLAALLIMVNPAFLGMVVYPINDLAFTLLFFWLIYIVITRRLSEAASWLAWAVWGILAGLLIWSKPSGVSLLAALFGYALWVALKRPLPLTPTLPPDGRRGIGRRTIISSLIVVVVALAVVSPLIIRNVTTFGSPFYSTESYDAWVLKWNPPFERIYSYWSANDLPNRSWLLRYGYDAIYRGIGREVQALWAGNSPTGGGSGLLGGDIGRPLAIALAILALFVAPKGWRHIRGTGRQDEQRFAPTDGQQAQGEQRFAPTESVVTSLLLSLVIYAAFVTLYWHYEPRYFYAYIPWVYLLASAALFWLYGVTAHAPLPHPPRLPREGNNSPPLQGRGNRVGLRVIVATLLVVVYAGFLLYTSISQLVVDTGNYVGATPLVAAAQWFGANTPPGTVAMSRNPWEFSWHSQRLGVMIPLDPHDLNRSLPQIKAAAQQYGATYLMLDHLGGPGASYFRTDWRRDIAPMYNPRTACAGFSLAYQNQSVAIYKMDASKIGASCHP